MLDNKQAPRCPYCGAEMRLEDNEDVLFGLFADEEKKYWYHCDTPSCDTYSPSRHTAAEAYKAATKSEPNRVLPFTELVASADKLVWLEDNDGDDEPVSRARKVTRWEHGSHRMYFDGSRAWYADYTYGETWRCWLRKPTPEEMANTPWEENDG